VFVHLDQGFFLHGTLANGNLQAAGYEYVLTLVGAAIAQVLLGGGALALTRPAWPRPSSCQRPRARTAGSSSKWKRQAGAPDAFRCSIHCQGGAAEQSPGSHARAEAPSALSPPPSTARD